MITSIIDFTKKNPFASLFITLVCLVLYQCLNLFWGFEMADSGFHLTAYENVFDAPDCVSYNFMYYLTNVVGGTIMRLFPWIGVFGFRVVGVLFIDVSIVLIFLCLRNEIPACHLLIGATLTVVSYFCPYSFCNGILSCFLYVCFLLLLYKGLRNNIVFFVFWGGFLAGINVFTRLPNILAVGVVVIILFHHFIEDGIVKLDWRLSTFFLFGVVLGVLSVFLIIVLLNHWHPFYDCLNILISKANGNHPIDKNYTVFNLIWIQIYFYLSAMVFICVFFTFFYVNDRIKSRKWHIVFVVLGAIAIFYYVYLNMNLGKGYEPLWGLCFIGCLITIKKNNRLSLLSSLALFMLLVEILGSGGGNNHGSLPALLAAPIASYALLNRQNFIFVLVACLALFLKVFKQGNFADFGPLTDKTFSINTKECQYIRTTQERAEVINQSLDYLRSNLNRGDTLLVFDCAPMMNYLTHTRPAGGQTWPALGDLKPFRTPPKILIHKFSDFTMPALQTRGVPTGNLVIDNYMKEHRYKLVFENHFFMLFIPN